MIQRPQWDFSIMQWVFVGIGAKVHLPVYVVEMVIMKYF
jgi:hypothetical protein